MKTLRKPLSKQIDLIEWSEDSLGIMLWKYPVEQTYIKYGAKLTVRDGQYAFIVVDDTVADVFKPGLYTLTVENMPRLAALNNWDKKFNSPFTADFYFFKTKFFIDQEWSLKKTVMVKDAEFGLVRINLSGTMDVRVIDAEQLLSRLQYDQTAFVALDACTLIEETLQEKFPEFVRHKKFSIINPSSAYDEELNELIQEEINNTLADFGLEIANFKMKARALGSEN